MTLPFNQPSPDLRSIIASLVGTFVLRVASAVMGSMIQLYFGYIDRSVYPLSSTMRGVALAVFFIPELLGSPALGAWSDRYGRKFFIWFSSLTGGIAVQIAALTTNFGALAVTRLLTGLSTASAFPATLGLLSAETATNESLRGRVMGLFQLATLGGTVIGILIGGRLWDLFQANAFTLNHAIYIVSLAIFFFGIREKTRKDTQGHETNAIAHGAQAVRQSLDRYRDVFLSPIVLRFAPAWLTINIILGVWLNQIIGQLIAPRGRFPTQLLFGILGDNGNAGTMISVAALGLAIVFVVGVIGWSLVLGKIRRTTVMLIGTGGLFALCAAIFALNHRANLDEPLLVFDLAFAFVALFGVSGLMPASLTYLADVTEARANDRGAIMGMYTIFFGAGQFIGTLLGGPFADWAAIDGILLLTALLGVFTTVMLVRLHRTNSHGVVRSDAILTKDAESDK
ncbi:MAG: MFS transporter [Chloroflexota bacterium]